MDAHTITCPWCDHMVLYVGTPLPKTKYQVCPKCREEFEVYQYSEDLSEYELVINQGEEGGANGT